MPPVYLLIRAGFGDAWQVVARTATVEVVGRTLLLALLVGIGAILVGVPMAWLIVRTKMPGSRWWAAACSLPLAMPSFVAAMQTLRPRPTGVCATASEYGQAAPTGAHRKRHKTLCMR